MLASRGIKGSPRSESGMRKEDEVEEEEEEGEVSSSPLSERNGEEDGCCCVGFAASPCFAGRSVPIQRREYDDMLLHAVVAVFIGDGAMKEVEEEEGWLRNTLTHVFSTCLANALMLLSTRSRYYL